MDKYNFFKQQGAVRPTEEQLLDTKLYYENAVEILSHWDQWKDIDRFYFTPLYLEMFYCMGWVAEVAPDPVWLGSLIRCSMENPELFQYKCPKCEKTILPYRYCGSPLSGVVDLEGKCACGWKGYDTTSGWRIRATALREQLARDTARYRRCIIITPGLKQSTVKKLLDFLRH